MGRRWIRLDVEWEESAWLDGLPGQSAGCWPRLLCWVKLRGKKGRCKAPDHSVLARRWRVPRQAVDELIEAALKDEAIEIEGDELVVTNWPEYQEVDATAAARKRRQRARERAKKEKRKSRRSHEGVTGVTRDTVTRPPTTDSDSTSPSDEGDVPRDRHPVFGSLGDVTAQSLKGLYGWPSDGISGTDERIWPKRMDWDERRRCLQIAVQRLEGEDRDYNGRFFRRILATVIEEQTGGEEATDMERFLDGVEVG